MSFFVAGFSCQAMDPYAIGRQTCEKHAGGSQCSSLFRSVGMKRLTLVLDIRLLESMAAKRVSSEELLPHLHVINCQGSVPSGLTTALGTSQVGQGIDGTKSQHRYQMRDAHHHLGRNSLRSLIGANHPHISTVQRSLIVNAVHCFGMCPPMLQAGPVAMPELPSWVSLPEDGPTRKAYFEVYRPGYSLKVRTRSHHQPHRLI